MAAYTGVFGSESTSDGKFMRHAGRMVIDGMDVPDDEGGRRLRRLHSTIVFTSQDMPPDVGAAQEVPCFYGDRTATRCASSACE